MREQKVLIVEDDLTFVELIKLALHGLNFSFDVARDGDEALGLLARNTYHLVISDFRLPKIHGVQILRSAKQHNRDCHAVLISAASVEEIPCDLEELDLLAYLQKPLFPEQIRTVVQSIC